MIIANGTARFIIVQTMGYSKTGDPVPDAYSVAPPMECNIVIKAKTNTAGDTSASFTRAQYEILTESVPAGAAFVELTDARGANLGRCQIQYSEPLPAVGAIKTIVYANQR